MAAADIELQKFCLTVEDKDLELPEHIRKLNPGDKTSSCDGRNTKTITRVPGGLQIAVVLRGGMPCYAIGEPRQAQDLATGATGVVKIFEAGRSAERFVAVDDSRFQDYDPNPYFEVDFKAVEFKTLEHLTDDVIDIKAEEIKDDERRHL